ncbi:CoA-transferase [Mycolicibacterium sp. CBMA 226]|uniref:CoA-transferase n=1 Tax=Mycolicibacterium sp. CBMA 226 TaxID=2606611 RepID=UPI001FB5A7FE|nr:CoA-transferase [Mycolicibacterium sp. CBMA 226]
MSTDPFLMPTVTSPLRDKVVTAQEAVRLIRSGDYLVVEGFAGQGYAEELVHALEDRFLATGTPNDLSLVFTVAQGNRGDRGFAHLCHEGMLKRSMGGHYGMAPALQKLAISGAIEAYNLPQGVIAQLIRDTGAGKPGLLTPVGLGTFADPRLGGGKVKTTRPRIGSGSWRSTAENTCSTRHSTASTSRSSAAPRRTRPATSPWRRRP